MIAGDTHAIGATNERDAGGGVAVVTDDIAEADDAVDRSLGNVINVASSASRLAWMSDMSASLIGSSTPRSCAGFCPPFPGSRRKSVERTTGIGSFHDSADFASQLTIQGNHVVIGTPAARAAGKSFQARHQRTPTFAGVVAGRRVPVKSA